MKHLDRNLVLSYYSLCPTVPSSDCRLYSLCLRLYLSHSLSISLWNDVGHSTTNSHKHVNKFLTSKRKTTSAMKSIRCKKLRRYKKIVESSSIWDGIIFQRWWYISFILVLMLLVNLCSFMEVFLKIRENEIRMILLNVLSLYFNWAH